MYNLALYLLILMVQISLFSSFSTVLVVWLLPLEPPSCLLPRKYHYLAGVHITFSLLYVILGNLVASLLNACKWYQDPKLLYIPIMDMVMPLQRSL